MGKSTARTQKLLLVIPAKAGIQRLIVIPAKAGSISAFTRHPRHASHRCPLDQVPGKRMPVKESP